MQGLIALLHTAFDKRRAQLIQLPNRVGQPIWQFSQDATHIRLTILTNAGLGGHRDSDFDRRPVVSLFGH